jgi:hypothetical protein
MHESLPKVKSFTAFTYTYILMSVDGPKGDLQELLGHVPLYSSPVDVDEQSSASLPHLPSDAEHVYHLVVMYAISTF